MPPSAASTISTMRSPAMPTSATRAVAPVPSTTVPFRMMMSWFMPPRNELGESGPTARIRRRSSTSDQGSSAADVTPHTSAMFQFRVAPDQRRVTSRLGASSVSAPIGTKPQLRNARSDAALPGATWANTDLARRHHARALLEIRSPAGAGQDGRRTPRPTSPTGRPGPRPIVTRPVASPYTGTSRRCAARPDDAWVVVEIVALGQTAFAPVTGPGRRGPRRALPIQPCGPGQPTHTSGCDAPPNPSAPACDAPRRALGR